MLTALNGMWHAVRAEFREGEGSLWVEGSPWGVEVPLRLLGPTLGVWFLPSAGGGLQGTRVPAARVGPRSPARSRPPEPART